MSFSRYPKYKNSGVEWLGEVPEHWEVKRAKFLAQSIKAGPFGSALVKDDYASEGYRVYGQEQVIPNDFGIGDYFITSEKFKELSQYSVSPGDILISCVGTFGKIAIVPDDIETGIINPRLIRFKCGDAIEPEYLVEVMRSNVTFEQFSSFSRGGTMDVINIGTLNQIFVAVPPKEEQRFIVDFLSRETGKIDELVAEQQRLMELLKEKRQAVISHAVTKGLNPRAPMKPSGIEWLGDVPEHWRVMPTRMIANIVRGASPRPAGDPRYFGGDVVPWVTVAEITKDDRVYLTETEGFLTEEGAQHSNLFPSGTLIYSNSGATLGVPKILSIDACANDGVVAFLKLQSQVHAEFLYHYLSSITDYIREKVKQGSGQPNLNTHIVKDLRFGVPPLDEQITIARRIAELIDEFGALSAEAQKAIDLLQERRTALISAAVTGQIDVRKLAAA
jgi:type I restriction enzyme S subunit